MATNFLNLNLPTVSVTLGPLWATEVNEAFETIDEHDHSSGKGKAIPTSGLNINADLDFNTNTAFNLLKVKLVAIPAALTGNANVNSIYSVDGDLYFTNSSGTAVQVTSGGSVVTSPSSLQTVERQVVSSDLIISPASTFVHLSVDTTATRTITLPLASSVANGRIYIIKDTTGSANTNNITVTAAGSDTIDGSITHTIDSDHGSIWVTGDASSVWDIT